jgi:thioesterase domain-containing protein
VEDDYFALGGSSVIAARLFAEISRAFGVKLPLTTILKSPTVHALSLDIEEQRFQRSGTLVELRRGTPRRLFLVHDGDGETLLYMNLARRLPGDLAVFGIEPRRIAGVPLAHASIEDMATFYIEEVRKKQPHGPYLFGGMCAGGVIAYEMASQLVQAGEKVELVALLDAATPQARKKPGLITKQRLGRLKLTFAQVQKSELSLVQRAGAISSAVAKKIAHGLSWEISHRWKFWSINARFRLLRQLLARNRAWPKFVPELNVRQIYDSAEARYAPKRLSLSSIVLVRAQTGQASDTPYRNIYADESFGWNAVAPSVRIIDVAGGHSSMLQEPFVYSLAEALTPYLQQTEPSPRRQIEAAMI